MALLSSQRTTGLAAGHKARQQQRRRHRCVVAAPGRAGRAASNRAAGAAAAAVAAGAAAAAAAPAPAKAADAADAAAEWAAFAGAASGEWEGVTASFAPAGGAPRQLPERFVPGAFREWGVELYDWQSQTSTLAAPGQPGRLRSVARRMMPTVGCEADAIAFTEEASGGGGADADADADADAGADGGSGNKAANVVLVARADGSYSAGPAALPAAGDEAARQAFELEHVFALPADNSAAPSDESEQQQQPPPPPPKKRVRVRVVQRFRRSLGDAARWVADGVDVTREAYEGPWTGRRELCGCGGGAPGIAQTPPLDAAALAGDWLVRGSGDASSAAASAAAAAAAAAGARLSCLDAAGAPPAGATTAFAMLPAQAWSLIELDAGGQLARAEAGVLLDAGRRAVSSRAFDVQSSRATAAVVGVETRAS